MASARSGDDPGGVRFIVEDDERITAVDIETGIASYGDSKADALASLADALRLHEQGGEPIDDPDTFLSEMDIEPLPDEPDEYPF